MGAMGAMGAMDAMANATKNFRDSLHEFASETDTKGIERVLREVENAARELALKPILGEVSSSLAANDRF